MPFDIHTPELRARLEVRAKPYFVRIADGLHLGYRKGKSVTRWVVRVSNDGRYRMKTLEDVEPDDRTPPDGVRVLDFQQAVTRMMSKTQRKIGCSFCGKTRDEVEKLVAGPGVFICDGCVAMCQLYMDDPRENEKLLIEDGKPVMRDGKPVFVPFTEKEVRQREKLLEVGA